MKVNTGCKPCRWGGTNGDQGHGGGGWGGDQSLSSIVTATQIPPSIAHTHVHVHVLECLRVLRGLGRHHRKRDIQRVPTRPVPLRAVSIMGRIGGKWAKREMILQRV